MYFFRVIVILHVSIILAGAMVSCETSDDITWINRNQAFILRSQELQRLEDKARNGNAKAAFEVFLHYSWGLHDERRGDPWLRLANQLHSPDAKNYLIQLRIAQPSMYERFMKDKTLP